MAENSKIEWTHHTFNPWRGCSRVSEGCRACYAEAMSRRNPAVLGRWGVEGTRVVASEMQWRQPIKWNRDAFVAGDRSRVFCASLADVFEEWQGSMLNSRGQVLHTHGGYWPWAPAHETLPTQRNFRPLVLDDVRRRLASLIWETQSLDWLLLTKRIENAQQMIYEMWFSGASWPKNYWLGTTVENRKQGLMRIEILRDTPAPVKFLSCEPLLEDLGRVDFRGIDWVIVGGESGPKARPMHPDWARSIRDQCLSAEVPFFFKQWGGWQIDGQPSDADEVVRLCLENPKGRWVGPNGEKTHTGWDTVHMSPIGKKAAGRLLDGRTWNEFPTPVLATEAR